MMYRARFSRKALPVGGCLALALLMASAPAETVRSQARVKLDAARAANPASSRSATTGPIGGPFLGYSVRAGLDGVRPIVGVPGAAALGELLPLGGPFRDLAVSSKRSYVLGVNEVNGEAVLVRLRPSGPSVLIARAVPAGEGADRVMLSPGGQAAVLYRRAQQSAIILRGLPADPAVAGEVSLAGLPAVLTALAVSDDASVVVAAVSQADRGSVYALSPGSSPRFLTGVRRCSAVSFVPGTRDVLVADHDANQILRIEDVTGRGEVRALAGPSQGVSMPVAVEAADDGRRVFVAGGDAGSVLILDVATGSSQSLRCACQVAGLRRLSEPNTFQLSVADEGSIGILRGGTAEAEVFLAASASLPAGSVAPAPQRQRLRTGGGSRSR